MKELVKMIISTHRRADSVHTLKSVDGCSLCCEESQVDEYAKFNPGVDIIAHPDTLIGIAAKYMWIHERYPNVCVLDDDVQCINKMFIEPGSVENTALTPDEAYDMIQMTAYTAIELGAKLFGFSKEGNPVAYPGHDPLKVKGLSSGGIRGFLKGLRLELDTTIRAGNDYYISGLNAYYHRFLFVDNRYYANCSGTFTTKGGLAEHRTYETEREDFMKLKEAFGESIVKKSNEQFRKQLHPYEKSFKIPL